MTEPPVPPNEGERLRALRGLRILDASEEERFDRFTRLAALYLPAPTAMINLVDEDHQWVKSRVGTDLTRLPRHLSFCAHAVAETGSVFLVPDCRQDARFADHPLVSGPPYMRFYLGLPLATPEGVRLGTLCLLDYQPRTVTPEQVAFLRELAKAVEAEMFDLVLSGTFSHLHRRLQDSETRLHQTEARHRGFLEELPVGVFLTEAGSSRLREVNRTLARWCGYRSPAEMLAACADTASGFYADGSLPAELGRRLAAFGLVKECEAEIRRRDGTTFWASHHVQRVLDPGGGPSYDVAVVEDVTERRYAAAAQAQAAAAAVETARLKSEFLSTVSHEIRTPLHGITGLTGMLRETRLDDEQRELVRLLGSCGDNLLGLINHVLDFSKIEHGGWELHLGPFNLRRLVDDMVDPVRRQAAGKRQTVVCQVDERLPARCVSDPAWLRQILANLLSNALKFTPEGGRIDVAVTGTALDEAGVTALRTGSPHLLVDLPGPATYWGLHFVVRDTGIGIPEDKLHRLFKPFSQADPDVSRQYGGTGLGLAICHRLCERLGGAVWLESEPGLGSSFEFTVQVAVPGVADQNDSADHNRDHDRDHAAGSKSGSGVNGSVLAAGPAALPAPLSPSSADLLPVSVAMSNPDPTPTLPPNLSILLTEDNLVNQRVALGLLRQIGCQADVAGNGAEALRAIQQRPYDVVLMDVQMPEMDGFEATRQIRYHWPDTGPYIIAMTANAMEGDRERCLAAGMNDYLAKPVKSAQLQEALRKAVRTRCPVVLPAGDGAAAAQPAGTGAGGAVGAAAAATATATASSLSPAALDRGSLEALKNLQGEGDDGFVRELATLFVNDAQARLKEIEQACRDNRADELARAAHTVKGACANFGATDLSRLCGQVEAAGRGGRLLEAEPLLPALRHELARVRLALEDEVGPI